MNAVVVYDSMYGNTERLARAIAEVLGTTRVVAVADMGQTDWGGCDVVVIGGPTQRHGISPAMRQWLDGLSAGTFRDQAVAVFDTRLNMSRLLTGSAAAQIAHALKRAGARLIIPVESFFVTGGPRGEETTLMGGEVELACEWASRIEDKIGATADLAGSR
jgi:flavorubredoxin